MSVEQSLREVLAEARPSNAPPERLRARLGAIPDQAPRRWLSIPRASVAAAAAVAVLVLVALAVTGLSTSAPNIGVPATQPPAPPTFDPTADGQGIVSGIFDTLSIAPWILAGAGIAMLSLLAVRGGRVIRAAAPVLVVGVIAAGQWMSNATDLSFGNGWGPTFGVQVVRTPSLTDGRDGAVVTAAPGERFAVAFNIRNSGDLPVHVLGIVEEVPASAFAPVWQTVGMSENRGGFPSIDSAQPFQPLDLAPGEYLNLYLVGRAGKCALGREVDRDADLSAVSRGPTMGIAYSVFGLTSVADVELPFDVVEPQQEQCEHLENP